MARSVDVLIDAARRAGDILSAGFQSRYNTHVKEDRSDYTPFDLEAETLAAEVVEANRWIFGPGVQIFGEDGKRQLRPEDLRGTPAVFIDGLDGTTNFVRGIPLCNFTANYAEPSGPDGRLELVAGVVFDFLGGEMYYAARGEGAYCNGEPIRVGERPFDKSVISFAPLRVYRTGKGEDEPAKVEATWAAMRAITEASGRFHRELQCGGLELAWVASGRLDGYASSVTSPWDLGAGVLLVREAGGPATNIYGEDWQPSYDGVIAGSPAVHAEFSAILRRLFEVHRR